MSGFERQGTLDKLLVAVLEERARARDAISVLRRLDASGSIDLFATRAIEVDALGRASVLDATESGPLGAAVRLLADRLLVALAGPPHVRLRQLRDDLVRDVAGRLRTGGAFVVAELWEQWPQPVDEQLSLRGGVAVRARRDDALLAAIERERAALETARSALRRARSNGRACAHPIEAVEVGLRGVRDRARAAFAEARAEHDAKMAVLSAKLEVARGPMLARLEFRISQRLAEHRYRAMALMRAATCAHDS